MGGETVYVVTSKDGRLVGVCRTLDGIAGVSRDDAKLKHVIDVTAVRVVKGGSGGSVYVDGIERLSKRPATAEYKFRCARLT